MRSISIPILCILAVSAAVSGALKLLPLPQEKSGKDQIFRLELVCVSHGEFASWSAGQEFQLYGDDLKTAEVSMSIKPPYEDAGGTIFFLHRGTYWYGAPFAPTPVTRMRLPLGVSTLFLLGNDDRPYYLETLHVDARSASMHRSLVARPATAIRFAIRSDSENSLGPEAITIGALGHSDYEVTSGQLAVIPEGTFSASVRMRNRILLPRSQLGRFTASQREVGNRQFLNVSPGYRGSTVLPVTYDATSFGAMVDILRTRAIEFSSYPLFVGVGFLNGREGEYVLCLPDSVPGQGSKPNPVKPSFFGRNSSLLTIEVTNDQAVLKSRMELPWSEDRIRLIHVRDGPFPPGTVVEMTCITGGRNATRWSVVQEDGVFCVPGLMPNGVVFVQSVDGKPVALQRPVQRGVRRVAIRVGFENDREGVADLEVSLENQDRLAEEIRSKQGLVFVRPIGELRDYTPTASLDIDRVVKPHAIQHVDGRWQMNLGAWPVGSYSVGIATPSHGFVSCDIDHDDQAPWSFETSTSSEGAFALDLDPLGLTPGSLVIAGIVPQPELVFMAQAGTPSRSQIDSAEGSAIFRFGSDERPVLRVPVGAEAISVWIPERGAFYFRVNAEVGISAPLENLGTIQGRLEGPWTAGMSAVLCSQLVSPAQRRVLHTLEAAPVKLRADGSFSFKHIVPGTYVVFAVNIEESEAGTNYRFDPHQSVLVEVRERETVDLGILPTDSIR